MILPDDKFIKYNDTMYYQYANALITLPTKKDITLWNTIGNISHIRQALTINIPEQVTNASKTLSYTSSEMVNYIGWCVYFSIKLRWYGTVTASAYTPKCWAQVCVFPATGHNVTRQMYSLQASTTPIDITFNAECGYTKYGYGDSMIRSGSYDLFPSGTQFNNRPLFTTTFYSETFDREVSHKINCDIEIDYLTLTDIA